MHNTGVLIVGAGQCGISAADNLRRAGYKGLVTLLGEEADAPYQRPPISKQALAGEYPLTRLTIRAADYFEKNGINLVVATRATAIDRKAKVVAMAGGTSFGYDKLILATGARPRPLNIPGRRLRNIFDLRTLADLRSAMPVLKSAKRLAVVGGGFVGLEVAATARKLGLAVTVLESEARIMSRVFGQPMSEWFANLHSKNGTELLTSTKVSAFAGTDRVEAVICGDREVPADIVVLGIGILPNQELASDAGVICDDGIVVDPNCRTSDPDIFAAGDCARHTSAFYKRSIRLESVHNANAQARVAANTIAGVEEHYDEIPWFWSDQYDVRLQMAGLSQGHDVAVVRGAPSAGKFTTLYLREDQVIAADCVNNPAEFMQCRKGIPTRQRVTAARLKDPDVSLADIFSGK